MTEAEADGLFHPNCRHAFSLYIPDNPYRGLTEEYLTRATEHINEMDEGEKKSFISQLAKRAGQPYNPDTKGGNGVYYDDEDFPIYPPNEGAYWPQTRGILKAGAYVDRYGNKNGSFLSPVGTELEKRSLPKSDSPPAEERTTRIRRLDGGAARGPRPRPGVRAGGLALGQVPPSHDRHRLRPGGIKDHPRVHPRAAVRPAGTRRTRRSPVPLPRPRRT